MISSFPQTNKSNISPEIFNLSKFDTQIILISRTKGLENMEEERDGPLKKNRVGFVFDDRMQQHKLEGKHHPECPERVTRIIANLQKKGIWDDLDIVSSVEPASKEIIELTHRESYVELV